MIGALLLRASVPRAFAAQSRMDIDAMAKTWADDIVMEWSGPSVLAGRFEGKEAVAAAFRRDFSQLAASHIEAVGIALTRPYALGLSNTMYVSFVAEVTTKDGRSGRVEGVSVSEIRRGKVSAIRNHYLDPTVIDALWGPGLATGASDRAPAA
jgi:ketosteroid isomerase-like protein